MANVLRILATRGDTKLGRETAHTANNGIVFHDLKVVGGQDVCAASAGNKYLALGSGLLHGGDLESGNSSLEGVNWVDLGDNDTGTERTKGVSTTLPDVAVTSNNSSLSSNHDISSTFDTVKERFTASVEVIELRLGDGVIDVNCGDFQGSIFEHLV